MTVLRTVHTTSCGASTGTAHVDGSDGSDSKPTHPPTPSRRTPTSRANQGGRA